MNITISSQDLHQRLTGSNPPLVVDVLPPEFYAVRHLPGACNACVYEIVFLQGVRELAPDTARPLVLYDDTGTTAAAATAREKLLAAGYRDVRILTGGLAAWLNAGYPLEELAEPATAPSINDGSYRLDTVTSVLEWTGRNINNRHYGRIPFSSGTLVIGNGELLQGNLTLDMTGISNLDLTDESYRQMLVSHLKSDDFFDVAHYPVASIVLDGWRQLAGATPGTPDHTVTGKLTIKNVTRQLTITATVIPQEDGTLKAQSAFDIDRTAWNINYGSGKLFEKLGMHLVNDRIDIELFLVMRRSD